MAGGAQVAMASTIEVTLSKYALFNSTENLIFEANVCGVRNSGRKEMIDLVKHLG
jgi:hypothetical protein